MVSRTPSILALTPKAAGGDEPSGPKSSNDQTQRNAVPVAFRFPPACLVFVHGACSLPGLYFLYLYCIRGVDFFSGIRSLFALQAECVHASVDSDVRVHVSTFVLQTSVL